MTSRRDFLKSSALSALGVGVLSTRDLAGHPLLQTPPGRAPRALRILILGGTGFIGPHQVNYALARGHTVTLFNRGQTNPGLFPNVEKLVGDRMPKPGNYESLMGNRQWDVVIDNPTTRPRWVREAAAALKGRVDQYIFISTISVYAANDTPGADETAAVLTTDTPDVEEGPTYGGLYGPLKALSEQEAEKAFPGRTTVIRPGLIVGIGDQTDRFTYWPVRIARGGEVLCPPATDPVQIIDARDLSEWTVRCAEDKVYGVYNATGPAKRFTVKEMVEGCRDVVKSNATFVFPTAEFLRQQQVRAWSQLPAWNFADGRTAGFLDRSVARAVSKGLTYRPFPDTVRETLAFYHTQTPERQAALRTGLPPEREKEVLAAWRARGAGE